MTSSPAGSRFIYVTYIRTTPERLWSALTSREFTEQYWYGMHHETDWQTGSPWRLRFADGRIADEGEVVESRPPTRLVLRWRNVWSAELAGEGESLCTLEIEPLDDIVKLTVTHRTEQPESKFIDAVSGGWPRILSNLKTLLETGEVLTKLKPAA